jgi:HEAT repeat protein
MNDTRKNKRQSDDERGAKQTKLPPGPLLLILLLGGGGLALLLCVGCGLSGYFLFNRGVAVVEQGGGLLVKAGGDGKAGPSKEVAELMQNLANPDRESRVEASQRLGKMGAAARHAIAQLKKALEDEDREVRYAAADALSLIAPEVHEAIPVLVEAVSDPFVVEHSGSKSLARYDKSALPVLVKLLPKKGAAETLALMGEQAVAPLAEAVANRDYSTIDRGHCARALGRIGPSARATIPVLTAALKTQNPRPLAADNGTFRLELASALVRIDAKDAYGLKNLNDCTTDSNPYVCVVAIYELARLNPTPQAVQRLIDQLRSGGERELAAACLGKLGPAARAALPTLRELANGHDNLLRTAAARSVSQIEAK